MHLAELLEVLKPEGLYKVNDTMELRFREIRDGNLIFANTIGFTSEGGTSFHFAKNDGTAPLVELRPEQINTINATPEPK